MDANNAKSIVSKLSREHTSLSYNTKHWLKTLKGERGIGDDRMTQYTRQETRNAMVWKKFKYILNVFLFVFR